MNEIINKRIILFSQYQSLLTFIYVKKTGKFLRNDFYLLLFFKKNVCLFRKKKNVFLTDVSFGREFSERVFHFFII